MSLVKNSSIIVFGIIISNLLAYVFHIYAGRMLGPVEYGIFGALIALFMIIALPAGAISSAIAKFSAKFNSKKEYNKIGILRKTLTNNVLVYSILLFLVITLFSRYIADYLKITSIVPIILVGFTMIFAMMLPINRGILQGMKKFGAYSGNTIIESVSRLIILIILLLIGLGVKGAVLSYGLGYFIAFLFIFPHIKETKIDKKEDIEINKVYKFTLIVFIVNLLLNSIINLPTLFIKHFLSSEFTGYWTAALTLARISLFITSGIALVMFSEVAEKENHEDKKKIFNKAIILTLIASIIIAILFWAIPGIFINLLYGKEFLGAVSVLQWMGIAMIFISLLQLGLNYWLARY